MESSSKYLEISSFSEYNSFNARENSIIFAWESPRNVEKIEITFSKAFLMKNGIPNDTIKKIFYWLNTWPNNMVEGAEITGSGFSGWKKHDDWYRGRWQPAFFAKHSRDDKCFICFEPLSRQELKTDIPVDFDSKIVKFRRTLKIKVVFDRSVNLKESINDIKFFTTSGLENHEFLVELGDMKPFLNQGENIFLKVDVFNGFLLKKSFLEAPISGIEGRFELMELDQSRVHHVLGHVSPEPDDFDNTLITIRILKGIRADDLVLLKGFSFKLVDLTSRNFLFIPDLDVLVKKPGLNMNLRILQEKHDVTPFINEKHELPAQFQVAFSKSGQVSDVKGYPGGSLESIEFQEDVLLGKSIHDRINELPEQDYFTSWNEFKDKKRFYFVVGCDSVRSKCAINLDGRLCVPKQFIENVVGRDTPRVFWTKEYLSIKLDIGVDGRDLQHDVLRNPVERIRDAGYRPVLRTSWQDPSARLTITQECFATLLQGTKPGTRPLGDDDVVVFSKLSFTNMDNVHHELSCDVDIGEQKGLLDKDYKFHKLQDSVQIFSLEHHSKITEGNNGFLVRFYNHVKKEEREVYSERPYIFQSTCSFTPKEINTQDQTFSIAFTLAPGEHGEVIYKFPLLSLETSWLKVGKTPYKTNSNELIFPREEHDIFSREKDKASPEITNLLIKDLISLDYKRELKAVNAYWDLLIDELPIIEVPNEEFNTFYKAHVVNVRITNDREVNSDRIIGRVGATGYGCYSNEVSMITMNLDRQGFHDEARKILEVFIRYQGTPGLEGDYDDIEGLYFGAGGYERGKGYNQGHGFVLWAIVEHFYLSHDVQWVKEIRDSLLSACDWIISERDKFKKRLNEWLETSWLPRESDAFPPCFGLLPPGGVEDITDYWFWFVTNAYNFMGLLLVAKMFSELGDPESSRLIYHARDYHSAIKKAIHHSILHSPVVTLRDGTFQPHVPCRVLRRGRGFGWIQEVLEGAIHLIRSGILLPGSQESTWIMRDLEDNLYLSPVYGYWIPDDVFKLKWFNLGGFSLQPWLLPNHACYLLKGQVKHFLRAFFNSFSVLYRDDTKMFTEHPLPTMFDWYGNHFKTSDEANFMESFRKMLVLEKFSGAGEPSAFNDFELLLQKPDTLEICSFAPRKWFDSGLSIEVERLPTYFGEVSFKIYSFLENLSEFQVELKIEIVTLEFIPRLKYVNIHLRHPDELAMIKNVKVENSTNLLSKIKHDKDIIHVSLSRSPIDGSKINEKIHVKMRVMF
ncbi:MAG: hypothetical protein ACTSVI_09285 [Promethearchaeota archaeon]